MIRKITLIAAFLGIFFASSLALAEPKFGTRSASVRRALKNGEIEEALAYYEALARARGKHALAGEAYMAAAIAASYTGQFHKSITYAEKALKIADKTKTLKLQFRAISRLVEVYRKVGRLDKSKEYLDRGFKFVKELPSMAGRREDWEGRFYSLLGANLFVLREYEEAIHALSKAIALREAYLSRLYRLNNQNQSRIQSKRASLVLTRLKLGRAYRKTGKFQLAMEQYQTALSFIKDWGLKTHHEEKIYRFMGQLYLQQKNYPQALQSLQKSLALIEKQKRPITVTSRAIGDVLRRMGRPDEAIAYYDKAILMTESIRSLLEPDYRQSFFGKRLGAYVGMIQALQ